MNKEIEDMLLEAFDTTALGREGMLPIGAMSHEGQAALHTLVANGKVVELPRSEMDNYSAGIRYGLAGNRYPSTMDEFSEFRDTGSSNTMTYDEFLDGQADGTLSVDSLREGLNEKIEDVYALFETMSGENLQDYVSSNLGNMIEMRAQFEIMYGQKQSDRDTLIKVLCELSSVNSKVDRKDLYELVISQPENNDFLKLYKEVAEMAISDIDSKLN